jgi:hypothetical protein
MSSSLQAHDSFVRRSDSVRALVLLGLLLVSGRRAAAQTEPSAPAPGSSAVQNLINEGIDYRKKGDDQKALTSFLKAYEISREVRALAQIALAEQALGRWVDAEANLTKALQGTKDPWIARNRAALEGALGEIQRHVGSLELSGGIPGAEIRLNGTPAGVFPLSGPIRTLAGSVALEVRADGYLPVIRTVIVPAGGRARELVTLVSVRSAAAATSTSPEGRKTEETSESKAWSTRKKAALGLGVGAIGAAAAGTAFYLLYRSRSDTFQSSSDHAGARCTTADLVDNCKTLYDDIHRAQIFSAVGFAGAGVLLGAATYMFMTDQPRDQGRATGGRGALSLRCLPSGSALACVGTF